MLGRTDSGIRHCAIWSHQMEFAIEFQLNSLKELRLIVVFTLATHSMLTLRSPIQPIEPLIHAGKGAQSLKSRLPLLSRLNIYRYLMDSTQSETTPSMHLRTIFLRELTTTPLRLWKVFPAGTVFGYSTAICTHPSSVTAWLILLPSLEPIS